MRTLLAVTVLVAAITTATTASAQPALTPFEVPAQPAPSWFGTDAGKEPGVAYALSIGGTLVPVLMVASGPNGAVIAAGAIGVVLGPSLGHWYAGDYVTGGLLMRLGGSGLMVVGIASSLGCIGEDESCSKGETPLVLGGALFVTGAIYDIATAGRSVHAWNKEHLSVAPSVISSNGHSTMGVGLGGTF